jgi:hypothetical protein
MAMRTAAESANGCESQGSLFCIIPEQMGVPLPIRLASTWRYGYSFESISPDYALTKAVMV